MGEGLGGCCALVTRLPGVRGVLYQTLDPGIVDGKQDAWTPPCVAAEGREEVLMGCRQSMCGPTDLRLDETVSHLLAQARHQAEGEEHHRDRWKHEIRPLHSGHFLSL